MPPEVYANITDNGMWDNVSGVIISEVDGHHDYIPVVSTGYLAHDTYTSFSNGEYAKGTLYAVLTGADAASTVIGGKLAYSGVRVGYALAKGGAKAAFGEVLKWGVEQGADKIAVNAGLAGGGDVVGQRLSKDYQTNGIVWLHVAFSGALGGALTGKGYVTTAGSLMAGQKVYISATGTDSTRNFLATGAGAALGPIGGGIGRGIGEIVGGGRAMSGLVGENFFSSAISTILQERLNGYLK